MIKEGFLISIISFRIKTIILMTGWLNKKVVTSI